MAVAVSMVPRAVDTSVTDYDMYCFAGFLGCYCSVQLHGNQRPLGWRSGPNGKALDISNFLGISMYIHII